MTDTVTAPAPSPYAAHIAYIAAAGDRRRAATMARIRAADAPARYDRQRRAAARTAGYRGPFTRDELAAQAARRARQLDPRAVLVQG